MSKIVLDEVSLAKLAQLNELADLCDAHGNVVGHFLPRVDFGTWEPISPEVSEEELDRREKSNNPRLSTKEVLACLEKMA